MTPERGNQITRGLASEYEAEKSRAACLQTRSVWQQKRPMNLRGAQFEALARELLEPLREELAGVVAALRSLGGRRPDRAAHVEPQGSTRTADPERRCTIAGAASSVVDSRNWRLRPRPSLARPAVGMLGAQDGAAVPILRIGLAERSDYVLIDPSDGRAISAPPVPDPRIGLRQSSKTRTQRRQSCDIPHTANGDGQPPKLPLPPPPSNSSADSTLPSIRHHGSVIEWQRAAGSDTGALKARRSRPAAPGGRLGGSGWAGAGGGISLHGTRDSARLQQVRKWVPEWADRGQGVLEDVGAPFSKDSEEQARVFSSPAGRGGGGDSGGGSRGGDKEGQTPPSSLLQGMARTSSITDCSILLSSRGVPVPAGHGGAPKPSAVHPKAAALS